MEAKGYMVDVKGSKVDGKSCVVDVKGYTVDVKGYMVYPHLRAEVVGGRPVPMTARVQSTPQMLEGVYSHDGPTGRRTRGYILVTDQSPACGGCRRAPGWARSTRRPAPPAWPGWRGSPAPPSARTSRQTRRWGRGCWRATRW
eukprot:7556637-Pyramimonas_sp.AAC.1